MKKRTSMLPTAAEDAKAEPQMITLDEPYVAALKDIIKSKSLLQHRYVLEKVYRYVLMSKDNERKWANKCRELTTQMSANSLKVEAALLISEEDKSIIETMKQEQEKSWKMVEEACKNELMAKDTIRNLKQEIAAMHEENIRLESLEGSLNPKRILKLQQEVTEMKKQMDDEHIMWEKEIADSREAREHMEKENKTLKVENERLNHNSQVNKFKNEKGEKRRIQAEQELVELKEDLHSKELHMNEQEKMEKKRKALIERLQKQLEAKMRDLKKVSKELENSTAMMNTVQREFEHQAQNLKESAMDIKVKNKELAGKDEKISALRKDIQNLKKQYHTTVDTLNTLRCHGTETDILNLKSEYEALLRQNDQWQNQCEDLEKEIAEMREDKDKMAQAMIQSITDVQNLESQLLTQEHLRHNLNIQIKGLEDDAKVKSRDFNHLETARTRIAIELDESKAKIRDLQQELKAQENLNFPKKLEEADKKLHEADKISEEATKARINAEKRMKEAVDDATDMREKIKGQENKIFYLKEQMIQQDMIVKRATDSLDQSYQDRHQVASELKIKREEHSNAVQEKKRLEEINERLNREILKMTEELGPMKEKFDKVVVENNMVETQLLRREDEVKLLMQKLEVQQRTLEKGHLQYRQLNQDTNLLKLHTRTIAREKGLMVRKVSIVADLRKELLHAQKELASEQIRAQALEDELKNPLNIHRWRILQGTDPEKYEMFQKIHNLQKLLIAKSEELVKQAVQIKEKDKRLEELEESVSRQTKANVADKLQACLAELKEKTKSIKTMKAQLNMYETYVAGYQCEIERLTNELHPKKYTAHTKAGSAAHTESGSATHTESGSDAQSRLPLQTRGLKKSKQSEFKLNARGPRNMPKKKLRSSGNKIK